MDIVTISLVYSFFLIDIIVFIWSKGRIAVFKLVQEKMTWSWTAMI